MSRSVTPKSGHATASLNGHIVADTTSWVEVEGNVYFPPSSVKREEHFSPTDLTTWCPWKGTAEYYSVEVEGDKVDNGAWYYAKPLEKAEGIKDHVAFYKSKFVITVE